ncbi:hypothetical protein ABZV52_14845 [Streptomyces sp. NPDC004735]|uniref:hypothetical protein n=2 Tax=Streptomyces TaxID=1883 RepID=UPI0033B3E477
MTAPNDVRLLPWSGPENKPRYLSTDHTDGYMSRLADNIEAVQLGTAALLLEMASESLADEDAEPIELRRLGHALTGVPRIAVSRRQLLAAVEPR